MKILHVCTSREYTEGFSYQDNLLTKFMVKAGLDVYLIASPLMYNSDGETVKTKVPNEYINKDGVHVCRLPYCKPEFLCMKLRRMKGFYSKLNEIKPDIIYIHLPQTTDSAVVAKYIKKNPGVKLFCDNHADYSNSARNWLSKNVLHKMLWKHYIQMLKKYAIVFYGVLPARVEFLKELYKLPPNKCKLLLMGGDDDLINKYSNNESKSNVRKEYNIDSQTFLIVTGGKIDLWKTETLMVMKVVRNINRSDVRLLVFGSVDKAIKKEFDSLVDDNIIHYIGWLDSERSYKIFSAADLVIFPGRHSVYWEQVAALGIPMICKHWSGTNHVDLGGNAEFIKDVSENSIQQKIESLIGFTEEYRKMKDVAQSDLKKKFFYSNIVKQILNEA